MHRLRSPFVLAAALALAACSSDDSSGSPDAADASLDTVSDSGVDASVDAGNDATADAAGDAVEDSAADAPDVLADGGGDSAHDTASDVVRDAPPVPEFTRDHPPASEFAAPEGYRWARSIIHLHSTHSHDACDGVPRMEDGGYNLPCLASLRNALCTDRIDAAWLTDHPTHMTEVDSFADLLLHEPATDTLVLDDEEHPYANWIGCENGHRVLVQTGAEDELMPIGLRRHVDPDEATRSRIMNEYTFEAAQQMREAGASIWVAHSEQRDVEDLRTVGIDGMEVYQLHANLDPRIRTEWLGLDAAGPVARLFPLLTGVSPMPPDLAFLVFVQSNEPSLQKWATLLQERQVVGSAGTDAHENVFQGETSDGERLDSYRRMMAWFSNNVLVEGELTPESARAGLLAGRNLIAFDVFGHFDGADFSLDIDGTRSEMGSSPALGDAMTLQGTVPTPVGPSGIEAVVTTIVWRADDGTWVEAARFDAGAFSYPITSAGVYRVEVRVTGAHFAPYVTDMEGAAEREVPWMMTNAWRIGLD